jgi:hypothetical protein
MMRQIGASQAERLGRNAQWNAFNIVWINSGISDSTSSLLPL